MSRYDYTRDSLVAACGKVLGEEVVTAMNGARIGMMRILDTAIRKAFVDHHIGLHVNMLREAAKDLDTKGRFIFRDTEAEDKPYWGDRDD
jgi:hypothetical protein